MNFVEELLSVMEEPARISLPVYSRNPGRLGRRLRFTQALGFYWVIVCRGVSCRLCGFREKPTFRAVMVEERDSLSGLRHRVPSPIVECCGRIVSRGGWRGTRFVLDGFDCDVIVGHETINCRGALCTSSLTECLSSCRGG